MDCGFFHSNGVIALVCYVEEAELKGKFLIY